MTPDTIQTKDFRPQDLLTLYVETHHPSLEGHIEWDYSPRKGGLDHFHARRKGPNVVRVEYRSRLTPGPHTKEIIESACRAAYQLLYTSTSAVEVRKKGDTHD